MENDLQKTIREIECLRSTTCQYYKGKAGKFHADRRINASDYVAYRLSLTNLDEVIRNPTQDSLKLLQLFGTVVAAVQKQIRIDASDTEIQGILDKTSFKSVDFNGGASIAANCQFTVKAFDAELDACGIKLPNTLLEGKDEVYQRFLSLPPAVKSMFFATDESRDDEEPFAMIRDILEFADEKTLGILRNQAHLDSKATFNETLNMFVNDFIQSEILKFKLKLGVVATKFDSNGKVVKASNKAQAIAQFCKPRKWIAKREIEN